MFKNVLIPFVILTLAISFIIAIAEYKKMMMSIQFTFIYITWKKKVDCFNITKCKSC